VCLQGRGRARDSETLLWSEESESDARRNRRVMTEGSLGKKYQVRGERDAMAGKKNG
jgi:hypothetical protein